MKLTHDNIIMNFQCHVILARLSLLIYPQEQFWAQRRHVVRSWGCDVYRWGGGCQLRFLCPTSFKRPVSTISISWTIEIHIWVDKMGSMNHSIKDPRQFSRPHIILFCKTRTLPSIFDLIGGSVTRLISLTLITTFTDWFNQCVNWFN